MSLTHVLPFSSTVQLSKNIRRGPDQIKANSRTTNSRQTGEPDRAWGRMEQRHNSGRINFRSGYEYPHPQDGRAKQNHRRRRN